MCCLVSFYKSLYKCRSDFTQIHKGLVLVYIMKGQWINNTILPFVFLGIRTICDNFGPNFNFFVYGSVIKQGRQDEKMKNPLKAGFKTCIRYFNMYLVYLLILCNFTADCTVFLVSSVETEDNWKCQMKFLIHFFIIMMNYQYFGGHTIWHTL